MKLSPAVERYVLHWGEMGTRWGTNRSVAQIQALLYLSPGPLRADEIVEGRKRRIYFYNPNGKLFAQADAVRGVVLVE